MAAIVGAILYLMASQLFSRSIQVLEPVGNPNCHNEDFVSAQLFLVDRFNLAFAPGLVGWLFHLGKGRLQESSEVELIKGTAFIAITCILSLL